MTCVYLWKPNVPQAGHLSLALSDGTTYISHWPKESKRTLFSVDAKQMPKLEDDIHAEGRNYDSKLEIPPELIDEHAIVAHWNELTSSASKYHALNKNCAQIVMNCIQVGVQARPSAKAALQVAIEDAKRMSKITKIQLRNAALSTSGADGPQFVLPTEIFYLLQMKSTMPAKAYYWASNSDEWGHLSLELSDRTYISHWPQESKSKFHLTSVPARQMRNLAHDIFAEKRDPDETIELCDEMLNEDQVKKYWNGCKSGTATKYHAVTNNCARVVLACVEIGIQGRGQSARAWDTAEEKFRKRILTIGAYGGADSDITSVVADMEAAKTTPADVLELVKYWKEAFQNSCGGGEQQDNESRCALL